MRGARVSFCFASVVKRRRRRRRRRRIFCGGEYDDDDDDDDDDRDNIEEKENLDRRAYLTSLVNALFATDWLSIETNCEIKW